jgi:hypothetical protein
MDNIIPLRPLQQHISGESTIAGPIEAFVIRTSKIYFVTLMYPDHCGQFSAKGYIAFTDGESLGFGSQNYSYRTLETQCRDMARRVARIYQGVLEKGVVDAKGVFYRYSKRDENYCPDAS